MASSKKKASALFFVIFLVVLALIGLSFAWHSFAIKNPIFSLELGSYDTAVSNNDPCVALIFNSANLKEVETDLYLKLNDKIIDSFVITLPVEKGKQLCISNSFLKEGDNFVEAGIYGRHVFFHVQKQPLLPANNPSLKLIGVEKVDDYKADINFLIVNASSKSARVQIFVNGVLASDAFFSDGAHSELVRVSPGANEIKVSYLGVEETFSYNNIVESKSNLLFGALMLAGMLFVLITFVFGKRSLIENIAFSLCVFFALLIALFFVLAYSNLLSGLSFSVSFLILIIAIALIFRKNFHLPKIKLRKPNYFEFFLALFLLAVLLFNFITPANVSFWTSFYERQSRTIFEDQGIPFFDELTHFGEKPYGYMSGYFFVDAGIGFLLGEIGEVPFALILFFSNLALILCAVLFFRKIGMSEGQSLLATMLTLLGGFLIGDVFFNVRHIVALALGLFSMYLLLEKKPWLGGLFLGVSIFVQTPTILILAIIAFALVKFNKKDFLYYFVCAGLVALVLFAPTLLLHGIPTQAKATTWGYLFGMPWYGVIVDLLAQLIFFFAIMIPATLGKPKLDRVAKKALVAVIILILIQLFITYRVNIATTIIFSFLSVYLFPKKLLEQVEVRHLLVVIFVFGACIASFVLLGFVVPDFSIHAADSLRLSTPSESRILAEPALGHYVAYFSERKIMADLAVEYADEQMLDDAFNFIVKGEGSVLPKYNIDFVFTRDSFVEVAPVGSGDVDKPIEFEFLDKIYDDSTYSIHKVR